MRIYSGALALVLLAGQAAVAQTTQGLIRGRIEDSITGAPVAKARVEYFSSENGQRGAVISSPAGLYFFPLLSPGRYRLKVLRDGYQPQEIFELLLTVAAFLETNFRLRPLSDVWETGQYRSVFSQGRRGVVSAIGPDFDAARISTISTPSLPRGSLEATVSTVVPATDLKGLPLSGRDAYALLVTHPGVVTDSGTARGLGLSVNGLRPSASSFLLDGVENNNYLVTGPLLALPPEVIEEYRISSNLFSAEYGRAGGYVANAITRSGANITHGSAYSYLKNEALDANAFQRNRVGLRRARNRELQSGVTASGPLEKDRTYLSGSLEYFRDRAEGDPVTLNLPTTNYRLNTTPQSLSRRLLDPYNSILPVGRGLVAAVTVDPPVAVDRVTALLRADRHLNGRRDRAMLRLLGARSDRPDFVWTPYKEYSSPLRQTSYGLLAGISASPQPNLTVEARGSYSMDDLHWDRARPEIPTLSSSEFSSAYPLVLPGSPAFYGYRNRGTVTEGLLNLMWIKGNHTTKIGGGLLNRRLGGHLTAGRDGEYSFSSIIDFFLDSPGVVRAGIERRDLQNLTKPDFEGRYSNRQVQLFAQDSWKVARGVNLNAGVRYENFGTPVVQSGVGASLVELGNGSTLNDQLISARIGLPLKSGSALYARDNNNFAGRFGFAWGPKDFGATVLRGGYGIFYDRPFDNLWQNARLNDVELISKQITSFTTNYLAPLATVLRQLRTPAQPGGFPEALLFQPGIRDAYVQSYFVALERRVGGSFSLEISALGSLGRKLITSDRVNRGQLQNPSLPVIIYRANQGSSQYRAVNATARYRSEMLSGQAGYTFGSNRDNQSEPLAGDFFDLNFTRANYSADRPTTAAFSRQSDSSSDRGRSDFDQRHNLVAQGVWQMTGKLRGWHLAGLVALRSGFPLSVLVSAQSGADTPIIYNNRAEQITGQIYLTRLPVSGGVRLLNGSAFTRPAPGQVSQAARNNFQGPGLRSTDVSIGRTMRFGERIRTVLRADAYNFLNHANLNPPDVQLDSPSFGTALYGRKGRGGGFPALIPFDEAARRVQLMIRLEF